MSNPLSRLRAWFARVRSVPTRVERLDERAPAVEAELERRTTELRKLFLEDLRGVTTQLHRHIDMTRTALETPIRLFDGATAEQGTVTRAAIEATRRDAAMAALLESLGPERPVRPGLSIFTITWNHADRLPAALASAQAVLDAVGGDAGEILVLDDASNDGTGELLDRHVAQDPRIRVVRAPANLGLSRARNVLLHLCDREHALMLDADNLADVDGAGAVYGAARRYGSTLTYGVLSWREVDGRYARFGSAGPVTSETLEKLDVDTFMVVDVEEIRRLGGWTLDPALEAMDDQELVRRVASSHGLLGFVPVLLGTYHVTRRGQSRARGDMRPRVERLERMYPLDDDSPVAAYVAHPDAGVLWASEVAAGSTPALAPPPIAAPAPDLRRILVVAPGGVGNLGDDLITAGLVERVTRSCPDHDVELVTDGGSLAADLDGCVWSGTIAEAVAALDRAQDGATSWLPVDPARLDGVVFGGGGNLNSIWHDDLVAHRARLFEHLHRVGVPMVVTGQGIGPFASDGDARAVRDLLADAQSIGVRDESSRAELTRLGLAADVVGDDALGLAPASDAAVRDVLRAIGADPEAPVVTLHARLAHYVGIEEATLSEWAAALDAIALERGAQVIGVALNWEPPLPEPVALLRLARERKAPWRILDEPTRPTLAAGVLRRSERALVGSYHAALVSIEARVPTLYCAGSDYTRRKAEGLADLAGLPPELVVTPGTPADELTDRFDSIERALRGGAGLQSASAAVEAWSATQLRALTDRARSASRRPGA